MSARDQADQLHIHEKQQGEIRVERCLTRRDREAPAKQLATYSQQNSPTYNWRGVSATCCLSWAAELEVGGARRSPELL